MCWTPL